SANWSPSSLVGLSVIAANIIGGRLNPSTLFSHVTYSSNGLADATHTLQVNQLAGLAVAVEGGAYTGTIASNTATAITLTANWAGGTPASDSLYSVSTPQASATVAANTATTITVTSAWTSTTPLQNTNFVIQVPAGTV